MVVSTDPQREQVLKLIEEKAKIEKKIADLGLVLQTVRKMKIFQVYVNRSRELIKKLSRIKSAFMNHSLMLMAFREMTSM